VKKYRLFELDRISHESGNCWICRLPEDVAVGEAENEGRASSLIIFEDVNSLGPSSSTHNIIREQGHGAYSHWNRELYFSTSDNSNPLKNKRRYTIAAPLEGSEEDSLVSTSGGPVNYTIQGADSKKIAEDSDYALRIARSYIDTLPGGPDSLKGKSALELGPGTNFATALALKALGAEAVFVADRFLAPFIREYHEPLYKEVGRKLAAVYPTTNVDVFESYARDGYESTLLSAVESPMEEIEGAFRDIDLTLSNAVFEHLFNPLEAIRNLYAVMSPGGLGFHQVDFRYHREFDRPLEYLLMDEISYARLFDSCHGECGNRTRPVQMTEMFKSVGFSSVECQGNMFAESNYLEHFTDRLRQQSWNPYNCYSAKDLSVISARFVLKK
jgi:SAM-dependent methyltransferase